jgi:hypothetical protein
MTILIIESFNSVFEILLPLIPPYSHYLYLKYDQYKLMSDVARFVNVKSH